ELDPSGIIDSARGEVARIFGCRAEELPGTSIASLVHPDAIAESVTDWAAMRASPGETRVNRRRFRRTDGSEVWIQSSYLHDGDGGIIGVLIDVTERVAREQEMSELAEQLA